MGSESDRLDANPDILDFFNHAYPQADLRSAGMTQEQVDAAFTSDKSFQERWRIFDPYWKSIRLTGYSQAITEGIRDLLGFDELNRDTVEDNPLVLRDNVELGTRREFFQTV